MTEENGIYFTTDKIREKIRADCKLIRDSNRSKKNDCLRVGLGASQVTGDNHQILCEQDVFEICKKIKQQKHITIENFSNLNKAFLQSSPNSITFVNTPGALQTLIKELTGSDSEQRIRACVTLCNLSLSDEFVCEKITSAAGSYLVTYLSSSDFRLKQTCLWVVTNIIATDAEGLEDLNSMKIIPKLFTLYSSTSECDEIVRDAGVALDLIYSSKTVDHEVKKYYQPMFCNNLHLIRHGQPGTEFFLRIIFNSTILTPECQLMEDKIQYLIGFSVSNFLSTPDFLSNENIIQILYSIRVLSNLLCLNPKQSLEIIEKFECMFEFQLHNVLNGIFCLDHFHLIKECLWLVKNVITAQIYASSYQKSQDFLNQLQIRKCTFDYFTPTITPIPPIQ